MIDSISGSFRHVAFIEVELNHTRLFQASFHTRDGVVALDPIGTDDQICRQQTGFGHCAPLSHTLEFVPCHFSPGVHRAPTMSSRSLASHGKALRSRRDGNVAVFDGACERTTRFLNCIDAGIRRMAVTIPLAGARDRELGLKRAQQVCVDGNF